MLTDPDNPNDGVWQIRCVSTSPACVSRIADFYIFKYRNIMAANRIADLVSIRLQTNSPTGKRYAY